MAGFTGNYECNPDGVDRIIDEKGNKFIAVREVRWKDIYDFKLDIRQYMVNENGEIPLKGLSFLTEDGPGELINTLLESGYGDTTQVSDSIYQNRKDIVNRIIKLENGEAEISKEPLDDGEDYYDPREVDLFDE